MLRCLGRFALLVLALLIAVAAWITRDAWYPKVRAMLGSAGPARPAVAEAAWEPLTPEGAARARDAIARLQRRDGPVYVNVNAGDLAAFALDSLLEGFSSSAGGVEARARDDRLALRARVSVADLGGPATLGPLSGLLTGKQEMTVRGRLEVLAPGRAQFRVEEIALRDLKLPSAVISRLVARLRTTAHDSRFAEGAIPVRVPRELADVRVGNGRVTLYKATP